MPSSARLRRLPALVAAILLAGGTLTAAETAPPQEKPADWSSKAERVPVFTQTMQELDQNGDVLLFCNTQDLMQGMMKGVQELLADLPIPAEDGAKVADILKKTDAFLKSQGFYSVRALGFSSTPDDQGRFVHKAFLARDPAAANAPLWKMCGGEPRMLKSLAFQPGDTALLFASNGDLKALWDMVREGVSQIGGEEAVKGMNDGIASMKEASGIDLEAFIAAIGDEAFVSLQLSTVKTAHLPLPGMAATAIPQPSLVIGIALRDAAAAEACLKAFLAKTPVLTPSTVGGQTVYAMEKPELPPDSVDFQPVVSIQQGFLFLASSPAALQAALDAAKNKNGFTTTVEYKKAFSGMPEKVNGVGYASPRLVQAITDIQKAAMSANPGGPALINPEAFIAKIQKMMGTGAGAGVSVNKPNGIQWISVKDQSGRQTIATIAAIVPAMLAAVAIPGAVKARSAASNVGCINTLRQIDAAKQQWALDHNKGDSDTPTWNDLVGPDNYLKTTPKCPQGGSYTIGPVDENPACTHPGHELP